MEKAIVLVDGSNAAAMFRELRWKPDWKKFHTIMCGLYSVQRCFYFSAIDLLDPRNPSKMMEMLGYNGWTIVSKSAKHMFRNGQPIVKGNMDIEMAVEMCRFTTMMDVSRVVLLTGDGDFTYAVKYCQQQGQRVTLVNSLKSRLCSRELRMQANEFIDIQSMEEEIKLAIDLRNIPKQRRPA